MNKYNIINDIRRGERPLRPTDPSRNRWLQDHIWDTTTTCWSGEPQWRCEPSVVYHVFSTPVCQDTLVESFPVGRKDLVRLTEEFLRTFLILPLDPGELVTLTKVQKYISDAISRDEASSEILPSAEAAALAKRFHEVSFPRYVFPQSLRSLVVRSYWAYRLHYGLPHFTCGSDFIPMHSSSNRKSSRT
jgi:hypothetical protein